MCCYSYLCEKIVLDTFLHVAPKAFCFLVGLRKTSLIPSRQQQASRAKGKLSKSLWVYLLVKPSFDALKLLQVENQSCKKDQNFHTFELAWTCPTCAGLDIYSAKNYRKYVYTMRYGYVVNIVILMGKIYPSYFS